MLGGITYLNNTAVIVEHIREDDMNSLKCTTALETCCQNPSRGDFYYPNGGPVLNRIGTSTGSIYRTRGSGFMSLKRKTGDPAPLGKYRCEIPDGRGLLQNQYITLGEKWIIFISCQGPERYLFQHLQEQHSHQMDAQ